MTNEDSRSTPFDQLAEGPRAMWLSEATTDLCKFAHKISRRATGTYAVHDHPFYEMVYIVSGQVGFYIAGRVFPIGGGTLLTFPPEVAHGVMVKDSTPYERYTLHFDPRALSMERRMLLLSSLPTDLLGVANEEQCQSAIWRGMERSGMVQIFEALEALRGLDKSVLNSLMPIYLEALLAALIPRTHPFPAQGREEARRTTQQQQIVSWVDQHYTEPVTLDTLADKFYLSKGYLSALFRQATGSSVKDYVRARRMAHVQMLLSTGMPAAQAAARVGFGDYTTFYRAYLRAFGHSPSADSQPRSSQGTPLAQALNVNLSSLPSREASFGQDAIVFPARGTEIEDPSMLGAVFAEEGRQSPSK